MFEIGNSLREARLRQGLDFPEIEQATKIRGKYLRSLEEEQFDVLPAQTYVKGFLRTYADYLGLDGQLYVDEFNSRYVRGELRGAGATAVSSARVVGARGGGLQGKAVMLTIAVIAGLTVFVFAAWKWGGTREHANPRPEPTAPAAPEADCQAGSLRGRGRGLRAVYRASRARKPIYQGTLEQGHPRTFVGQHLGSMSTLPPIFAFA